MILGANQSRRRELKFVFFERMNKRRRQGKLRTKNEKKIVTGLFQLREYAWGMAADGLAPAPFCFFGRLFLCSREQ